MKEVSTHKPSTPGSILTRRKFIGSTALAALGSAVAGPYLARAEAGKKINIATIGAGGKGTSDTNAVASENIVALCDVDETRAAGQLKKFPNAKFYRDFRILLEKEKDVEAVIVATPDHLHAPAAVLAMKMGKHVYCQKPLTHSVYEARLMRQAAKEAKVATQMGNQGSAQSGLRRAVEVVQAGIIGPVRQVHVWSNRPIWPQGLDRPEGEDPVPGNLDWDLWLGPAPFRPYKKDFYHPFKWRGWQDFGTGALGDMACHTANMPFRALKLGYPLSIEAESSGMNKETYPKSSKIHFEFPAREEMPAVSFFWYDGKPGDAATFRPQGDLVKEVVAMTEKLPGSGCLLIGDKGKLFSPDDYGAQFYLLAGDEKEFKSGANHEVVKPVAERIPRSPGHYKEWLDAIRGGPAAYSNFDIAAYLTEIILLGCVALRVGRKLEWDGPNMKAANAPEAAQFIKREYRGNWSL